MFKSYIFKLSQSDIWFPSLVCNFTWRLLGWEFIEDARTYAMRCRSATVQFQVNIFKHFESIDLLICFGDRPCALDTLFLEHVFQFRYILFFSNSIENEFRSDPHRGNECMHANHRARRVINTTHNRNVANDKKCANKKKERSKSQVIR